VTLIYKIHTSIEEPFWNPIIIIIITIIPLLTIGSNWVEFLFFLVGLLLKLENSKVSCAYYFFGAEVPNPNCIFDAHNVSM